MSFYDLEKVTVIEGNPRRKEMNATESVASGIFQINTALVTFRRHVNTLGTPKDTPELREKLHKTRLHIGQLVKDTSFKLKQEGESDLRTEVSQSKKISDAKLAKDFQAVVKEFLKSQKLAAERETMYSPFVHSKPHGPSSILTTEHRNSDSNTHLDGSKRQQVVLLENEITFNEAVIEEREQGIREVEQQIGEVNEIFKDLAVLVHDQAAIIDDVGSQMSKTNAAVSQGKSHLTKAALSQRSNSSLTCLLLVIFGISLLIVFVLLKA